MVYLIPGLLIFFLIHLVPSLPLVKSAIVGRTGSSVYKVLFSLLALFSLVLIVLGMRSADFVALYQPPLWGRRLTFLLSFIAIYLFLSNPSSPAPSSVKAITPSPLSWGVVTWSLGHLFSNGDLASVMLFAMFLLFGFVSIFSTRSQGDKPELDERPPVHKEVVFVVMVMVVYGLLMFGHRYFAGVAIV